MLRAGGVRDKSVTAVQSLFLFKARWASALFSISFVEPFELAEGKCPLAIQFGYVLDP